MGAAGSRCKTKIIQSDNFIPRGAPHVNLDTDPIKAGNKRVPIRDSASLGHFPMTKVVRGERVADLNRPDGRTYLRPTTVFSYWRNPVNDKGCNQRARSIASYVDQKYSEKSHVNRRRLPLNIILKNIVIKTKSAATNIVVIEVKSLHPGFIQLVGSSQIIGAVLSGGNLRAKYYCIDPDPSHSPSIKIIAYGLTVGDVRCRDKCTQCEVYYG